MNKTTIHHFKLYDFSRHIQPGKIKMSQKRMGKDGRLPKLEVIRHAILSMMIRQVHKASQLAEEQSLLEEINGNDSLGG